MFRQLRSKLVDNLAVKYGVSYIILAAIVVLLVYYIVRIYGWPEEISRFAGMFALFGSLYVFFLIWICEPADPTDRRLFLREANWLIGPPIILTSLWFFTPVIQGHLLPISSWLGVRPGTPLVMLESAFDLAILMLIVGIWSSLRWPFTRNNILLKSKDEKASQIALSRLVWPSTVAAQQAAEIRIAPGLYFSFLSFIYWVTFVVVETILSELLGDKLRSAGYLGAAIIAVGIGAAFYPIHNRANKYVDYRPIIGNDSGAEDLISALLYVGRSMRLHIPSILRFVLYLFVFVLIVGVTGGLVIRLFSGCGLNIFAPC